MRISSKSRTSGNVAQVVLALHAGADDRQRARVRAREHVGRHRGGGARADRGDVGAVHERAAGAGARVVEPDRGEVDSGRGDSKTVTTFTVIAPSRRRPGIPSRNASSGIVSSLRPGRDLAGGERAEAVAQASSSARGRAVLDLARLRTGRPRAQQATTWRCGERVGDDAAVASESAARSSPSTRPRRTSPAAARRSRARRGGGGRGGRGRARWTGAWAGRYAAMAEKDAIRADYDAPRHDLRPCPSCAICATSSRSRRS